MRALLLLLPGLALAQLASPREAEDLEPAADILRVRLQASEVDAHPFHFAYNGQTPGPTLRAKVGDTLVVELDNQLPNPTTIHWHGVAVPWEMDGVTWMGAPVGVGEEKIYTFELTRAGTFWYHPHFDTGRQVDLGLYGMLIVEDPADPPLPELVLVLDTESEHDEAHEPMGHGRELAPSWLVNGAPAPTTLSLSAGEAIRVRVLNASNVSYAALSWPGLRQIAGEQGLLAGPLSPERALIAPGQRADFEWLPGAEDFEVVAQPYTLNGGDTYGAARPLISVQTAGEADPPEPSAYDFSGAAPAPIPTHADLVFAFAGSDRTGVWLINGERFPEVTVPIVPLDSHVVLDVRNLSPTEHPFHLHGHHFEVLAVNGVAPSQQILADTWNLKIRDRVLLGVHADNPGDWMAHCHILPHAGEGMMTVLRVE